MKAEVKVEEESFQGTIPFGEENGARPDFKIENLSPNVSTEKEEEEDSNTHTPPPSSTLPVDDVLNEESTRKPDSNGAGPSKSRQNLIHLSAEAEKDLAKWYSKQGLLYNKRLKSFRNKKQKARLYREKASQLNISVKQLQVWCEGMIARFTHLCNRGFGNGEPQLSEREAWIQTHFAFLKPHIVRCHRHKSKKHPPAKSFPPSSRTQDVGALPDEERAAVDDLATVRLPLPIPATSVVAPQISKCPRVDVELIEKTIAAQQDCVELNTRFLSLLQPHSQHTVSVKQFHSFLATMVEQMAPETFEVYTRDAMALVSHYLTNPLPPRDSGSRQQPPQYPAFSDPHRYMAPLPIQPSYPTEHQGYPHGHHSRGRVRKQLKGKRRKKACIQSTSLLGHLGRSS